MKHLSYATSIKLAKFLGNLKPAIFHGYVYRKAPSGYYALYDDGNGVPAYTLEDILSKPFCAALANKIKGYWPSGIHATLADKYWDSGFAAVEREIVKLMGAK